VCLTPRVNLLKLLAFGIVKNPAGKQTVDYKGWKGCFQTDRRPR
jgi:hypothetical protein